MQATGSSASEERDLRFEIQALLQAALLVFIFTAVVGILNGTDVVDFDQKTILTHVHTGTLGWITLSVFAAALWLFGKGAAVGAGSALAVRLLTVAAVATIPAYNLAFLTTYGEWRPVLGCLVLTTIVGFLAWVLTRARAVRLTTPHLGMLAAVATSATGGLFGVLWGFQLATGDQLLPEGGEDVHPATMVLGFLVPVGMALAEWCFAWPQAEEATTAGRVQIAMPFAGGVLVIVGILLDAPPIVALSLPFEVIGLLILLRRLWPHIRRVRLTQRGKDRFAALSVAFLTVNIGLFFYMITRYAGDFDKAPERELLALDHVMFIGVMTNAILGLLYAITEERRDLWRGHDDLIFWGMNAALAGFAVGLFADVTVFKQIFTPVMGAAILLAIVTYSARLRLPAGVREAT